MRISLLTAAVLLTFTCAHGNDAQASAPVEIYHCVFTEPFFNFTYNSDTKELRKEAPEDYVEQPNGSFILIPRIETGVQMSADASGKLVMTDRSGRELYTLELMPGSNGMSNRVYPYDGVAKSDIDVQNGQHGGCYSTSHPLNKSALAARNPAFHFSPMTVPATFNTCR